MVETKRMIADEVFCVIIKTMKSIHRKCLLSADIRRWLDKQTFSLEKTEKFYIKSKSDTECYYLRTYPDTYAKVLQEKGGEERVLEVTKTEYMQHRKKHIGRKLLRRAYKIIIDEEVFIVFEYLKKLEGLYLLESYFMDQKQTRESKTIEKLQPFILKEVDKDNKYLDKSLALHTKPMEYDLNKFFDKIDAYEAANLFFWQVPKRMYVRDGVVLVIYKNLRLIHHYQVNFQSKHFPATLHRLRVLLRRTATLMHSFSSLFNPSIERFSTSLLMRYHDETKQLRYLYFLEELCATKKDASLSLHSTLKSLTLEEERAVVQMLFEKPFRQLIQIMTRELYEEGYHQGRSLKKEVKKVVKQHLTLFKSLLQQTKEGYNERVLEELYVLIDALQTLVEDFYHLLGEQKTQLLVEELNILLKPLREYRNCRERQNILKSVKESAENKSLDISPLLCTDTEELQKRIEHALRLLRASDFYI